MTDWLVNIKIAMSPRTKEQIEEIKNSRKNQILETSLRLFAYNGFHNTSIDQIAKETGISKGLVYNYFESKEELLQEVFQKSFSDFDQFAELIASDKPKQVLREVLDLFFNLLEERTEMYLLVGELSLRAHEFPFVLQYVGEKHKQYLNVLTTLLQNSGMPNPEDEAYLLMALLDGISTQYLVLKEKYPLNKYKAILISKYCS